MRINLPTYSRPHCPPIPLPKLAHGRRSLHGIKATSARRLVGITCDFEANEAGGGCSLLLKAFDWYAVITLNAPTELVVVQVLRESEPLSQGVRKRQRRVAIARNARSETVDRCRLTIQEIMNTIVIVFAID